MKTVNFRPSSTWEIPTLTPEAYRYLSDLLHGRTGRHTFECLLVEPVMAVLSSTSWVRVYAFFYLIYLIIFLSKIDPHCNFFLWDLFIWQKGVYIVMLSCHIFSMANILISLINCKIRLAAESLGLPFLSAYLSSVGSNFTTGANFATSGSTIQHPNVTWFQSGYSPFSLDIQTWQFNLFKSRSKKFHDQGSIHQCYTCCLQYILRE